MEEADAQTIIELSGIDQPNHVNVALAHDIMHALGETHFSDTQKQSFASAVCEACFEFHIMDDKSDDVSIKSHKALRRNVQPAIRKLELVTDEISALPCRTTHASIQPLNDYLSNNRQRLIEALDILKQMDRIAHDIAPITVQGRPSLNKNSSQALRRLYEKHLGKKPTTAFMKDRDIKDPGEQTKRAPSVFDRVCKVIETHYAIEIPEAQRRGK